MPDRIHAAAADVAVAAAMADRSAISISECPTNTICSYDHWGVV
jgi:hypothetical protein